jgi:predicted nucleic acid-binding protein
LVERIYLDTNILVDAIVAKDSTKSDARRSLYRITIMSNQVYIPQIILGESVTTVIKKSDDGNRFTNIKDLIDWTQKLMPDAGHCTPVIEKDIIDMTIEIKKDDNRVDYCDAILVSHAILDREARYILTKDKGIHRSDIIQTKICERDTDWCKLSLKDSID